MSSTIAIEPLARPPEASVRPPGSKSLTNRAMVCAALAEGTSTLHGALDSQDTRVMIEALKSLGISVESESQGTILRVEGCGGLIPATLADLYVANSGTTVRFLAALVSLGHGKYRLHGSPRMHERPIGDLLAALRALGAKAESELGNDCPPAIVHAAGLAADAVRVRGDVSSQFLSALLMVAPYAARGGGLAIDIDGPLVSKPYVDMTLAVMRAFGATVDAKGDYSRFQVGRGGYTGRRYEIEPDASAASYFWAAAAITGGRVRVEGLDENSVQGDVAFCQCLARMGCQVEYDHHHAITVRGRPLKGIDVDKYAISDTAQTLAAVALFADGPTEIRGVAHIRHKETDRVRALATELRKFGVTVDERHDGLRIVANAAHMHGAEISTYDDHRMAMSMALVGLKLPGVTIRDPQCTEKTYPKFFEDLERLRR